LFIVQPPERAIVPAIFYPPVLADVLFGSAANHQLPERFAGRDEAAGIGDVFKLSHYFLIFN